MVGLSIWIGSMVTWAVFAPKLNKFDNLSAVADIIYRPSRTPLLLEAEKLGLPNLNGGGMLLYQGTAAFSFWTGREAPESIMRKELDEHLSKI